MPTDTNTDGTSQPTVFCRVFGHKEEDVLAFSTNTLHKRCEWCGHDRQVHSISSADPNPTLLQRIVSPIAEIAIERSEK